LQIFRHARNLQRIKVEPKDVLLPFFLLYGSNFIVLLVWTFSDPVHWVREPIDDPGTDLNLVETSTYGNCDSEHYRIYLGIILGVNMMVSVIMLIQAYECRKISTDYSESLWISGAMVCIVQVWIIGLPVLKLLDDNPKAVFVVEVVIVFVSCMSTLLLVFVPKIRYLRQSRLGQKEDKGGVRGFPSSERRESVTDHEHSLASEDTYGKLSHGNQNNLPTLRMGNLRVSGLEPPASSPAKPSPAKPRHVSSGLEGIRIIQSSSGHSEEVERLQKNLEAAEARNKILQDRLERLQEKMEQYVVAHHPHGESAGSFIIQARVSGTTADGESR
jgi:hypothetical protein